MEKVDIIIKNGHVVDPSRGVDGPATVAMRKGRIVEAGPDAPAVRTVDAAGCYVFPGLIDFHTHIFHKGNPDSISPDLFLSTGVTTAVDPGSMGWINFNAFYNDIVCRSHLNIKAFMAYSKYGVDFIPESNEDADVQPEQIARVFEEHGEHLVGIKIRMVEGVCHDLAPLRSLIRLADRIKTRISIHVSNPPEGVSMEEVADLLRPGDIFTHMYHGRRNTIIDANGKVKPAVRRARERGVLFDMSNGRGNYCFATSRAAIDDGFLPDIVSTDNTSDKMFYDQCVRDLPYVMSKLLEQGIPLNHIIQCVTQTPAQVIGMEGQAGTLAPGAIADVAVFTIENKRSVHEDFFGKKLPVNRLFKPQMTIRAGEMVFCQADFNLFTA